jgi:hypothetical protein
VVLDAQLVVVETIYHAATGCEPTAAESRFARKLETDEQPYTRRITVTQEWQQVDTGWITEAGMLRLANKEGEGLQVQPTAEERAAMASKIVELSVDGSAPWLIFPGESFRGMPSELESLRVRCRSGEARCLITIFPR